MTGTRSDLSRTTHHSGSMFVRNGLLSKVGNPELPRKLLANVKTSNPLIPRLRGTLTAEERVKLMILKNDQDLAKKMQRN